MELPPAQAVRNARRINYVANGLPNGVYILSTNTPLEDVLPATDEEIRHFVDEFRETNR